MRDPEEEAVELALGQAVGALLLDRVLGGDHHERWCERVRHPVGGDLALLHGLEERRLGLRRRPVDLVGEDDVGEDRSGLEPELLVRAFVDAHPDQVGRQQVGGELHALPGAVDRRRERLGEARLAHPRHVLDQEVPLGEQCDDGELDRLALAVHHRGDVGHDPFVQVGEGRGIRGARCGVRHGWEG